MTMSFGYEQCANVFRVPGSLEVVPRTRGQHAFASMAPADPSPLESIRQRPLPALPRNTSRDRDGGARIFNPQSSISDLPTSVSSRLRLTCPASLLYRAFPMSSAEEIVAIVDEQNNVVGALQRKEMRARRLPHRSTYILVFNSAGELYVQKRTLTKDVFPGYYDTAAGGVVLAGESYLEGAKRELEEEMGIRDVPLTPLFVFYYNDERSRVWGAAFSCVYDGDMVLQEEEVESGTFMNIQDVLQRAETLPFTPDGLYVLRRYLRGC